MEKKIYKGKLITFEGPEGGGKTTQIQLLAGYLKDRGFNVITSREPGGTGIGISIRNILLDPSFIHIDSRTELMLFLADRAQHVQEIILPALEKGSIVICDRYTDSTIAYQVGGRNFPEALIEQLNEFSSYGIKPDLTLLLDVDYSVGIKRATKLYTDRFELEKQQFHERIRQKYHDLQSKEPQRIRILDTTKNHIEIIQKTIRQILFEEKIIGGLDD
ncbi:MAG: dTMP kinase [Candidatus Margulisbacteria bacterium]|nr:dTMP kinase [Candidatus Margulisiibacteriota bacterium]